MLRKNSLPGIGCQFRKSPSVGERCLVGKSEFGGDLLSLAELFGALFGFGAEADGGEPGPAGIEREPIRQQVS